MDKIIKVESHLKEARNKKGISQFKLAVAAGVTQQYIQRLESGYNVPSLFLAYRLSDILEVSVFDLFKEVESNEG